MTPWQRLCLRFATQFGGLAAVWAVSIFVPMAPCWSLIFPVVAFAWLIWLSQREYALFQHRIHLVAVTREESTIRRWFWRGSLTSNIQLAIALFWAGALIFLSPGLGRWHYALLAIDVAVVMAVAFHLRRTMVHEIRDEALPAYSRNWAFVVNVVLLACGAFIIDYFIAGAPDTRGFAWNDLAERAFLEHYRAAACPLAGVVLGGVNAVDQLAWHFAEVIIPSLPNNGLKVFAWIVFLLQSGAIAYAFTRLQLGIMVLLEYNSGAAAQGTKKPIPAVLPVLVVGFLIGTYALPVIDLTSLPAPMKDVVVRINPCRNVPDKSVALRKELKAKVEAMRVGERARVDAEVDRVLEAMFAEAERGVDGYLDWYFSLLGEYSRLAVWIGGLSKDKVRERVEQEHQERVFGTTGLGERVKAVNGEIAAIIGSRMSSAAREFGERMKVEVDVSPCALETMDLPMIGNIQRDVHRVATAMSTGLTLGVVGSRIVAGRFTPSVARRLASTRAYSGAATIASRLATKRAGSTLIAAGAAAAACAPGGPLAAVCAIAAGAAVWVATDKAMLEIDEYRYRGEMREELLGAVRAQKDELAQELKQIHGGYVDTLAGNINRSVDQVFIPARDS